MGLNIAEEAKKVLFFYLLDGVGLTGCFVDQSSLLLCNLASARLFSFLVKGVGLTLNF